jgi:hypothetical protein
MGSSARNRKSGKPDKLPRTPSVAKKLTEFLKGRGVPQDPLKALDFRVKKPKKPKDTD